MLLIQYKTTCHQYIQCGAGYVLYVPQPRAYLGQEQARADGLRNDFINANLTSGADLTQAVRLPENAGLGFKAPSAEHIDKWYRALCNKGVDATIRWSKGQDISAACGQLAGEVQDRTRLRERDRELVRLDQ